MLALAHYIPICRPILTFGQTQKAIRIFNNHKEISLSRIGFLISQPGKNTISYSRRFFASRDSRSPLRQDRNIENKDKVFANDDVLQNAHPLENTSKVTKETAVEEEQFWQEPSCLPVPPDMPNEKLLELIKGIIAAGRLAGFLTAANHLEYFLSKKGGVVSLNTQQVATAPLVLQHLGPSSNPQPQEPDIRRMMGDKAGIESLAGEHHVVFMAGVLKRLEKQEIRPGQRIQLQYKDSISFYNTSPKDLNIKDTNQIKNHTDLAYAIGGATLESQVEVQISLEEAEGVKKILMHYISWKCQLRDPYNWDKFKTANFGGNFCIPDSDLARLRDGSFGREFFVQTEWWNHTDKYLNFWFEIPYRLN